MLKPPNFFVKVRAQEEWLTMNKQNPVNWNVLKGIVFIMIGLIIWLWSREHSPYMGLGEMLMDTDNWVFKKPFYLGVIMTAALFSLLGVVQLYRGLRSEQNANVGAGNNAHIFCSECGTQCPANTAFCSKCGSKISGA